MGQITIYLDDDTEKKMKRIIKKKRISKSRWVSDLIREKTEVSWPDHIVSLVGAWPDFPTAEEIRKRSGKDLKRRTI